MYSIRDSSSLGVWYDPLKEAVTPTLKEAARAAIPMAMDVAIPAALDYVDRNRIKIWRKAKPVVERFGQDETVKREMRPVIKRVAKRELARYGRDKFYPKYGKYAAPAVAVGAGFLAGGLGTGYSAVKRAAQDPEGASRLFALTYLLQLGGIGLTLAGIGLSFGNRLFPHT